MTSNSCSTVIGHLGMLLLSLEPLWLSKNVEQNTILSRDLKTKKALTAVECRLKQLPSLESGK